MHPLLAYDIARQRHADLIAKADRHRVISTADRDGRQASHPPVSSVWARLLTAMRTLVNVTKADERQTTVIVLGAAGVGADGRSATTSLGAPLAPDRCVPTS